MDTAPTIGWRLRARLFVERFWQPTSACMMCMPGSLGNLWSATHWLTALQTGLVTGVLALLISFTPLARLYRQRLGNAAIVGSLTAFGDAYAHPNHYGFLHAEALLTGVISAVLAWVASYLLEDRARRVRRGWARLRGRAPSSPGDTV
jgi:cell division inhibitor SulA